MACKNCQTPLSDESLYCTSCGGKIISNRLTIKNLFEDFSATFFNYDNKFLKTFINLFRRPEEVIGSYIQGTRKKYVDVISYFAIALTVSGLQIYILNKFFPNVMNIDFLATEGMESFQRDNMSFTQEYQSILYMLAVPLYALMSRLIFYNYKTFNYTEHIVINMYMSAHFSIVGTLVVLTTSMFGINYMSSALVVIVLQIIFSAFVFKRLYNLTMGSIILKSLLFLLLLFVLFVAFSILSAIIMYLNGDFERMR